MDRTRASLLQEEKLSGHLDTKVSNLQGQVDNLIEKNDNQAAIINETHDLPKKYDDSLKDWVSMRDNRDEYRELYADSQAMLRDIKQTNYNASETDAMIKRLRDDLKVCQASNREALAESTVADEMVEKIVDVMQGAGYDISGSSWGDDTQLGELEDATANASQSVSEVSALLDEIRTQR